MTDPLFHQINDLSELISKARDGFSTESRAQWYPRLPKIVLDGTEVSEMSYSDLLLSCEKKFKNDVNAYELERKIRGVPTDLRSRLDRGKLDRPGVEKVYDIITILSFRYRISSEDVYLVEPLVYYIAAAVRRIDACFSACSDMIRKSNWYITATMLEHRVKIFSFQDLVEVVMPATYRCLMALKALTDEHLNNIFVGLFFSLLPREQAYRILDSFLLEGGKILYRYGTALISLFKTKIKAGRYRSGEHFWSDVAATCHSDSFNFDELHCLAFDKRTKSLFKIVSRKRKINRRNISELKNQIRDPLEKSMALTKNSSGTIKLSTDICIQAAVSTWFDKALWARSRILDTTMAIKLQLYLAEAMQPAHHIHSDRDRDRERDRERYDTLPPVTMKKPGVESCVQDLRLVFSTAIHGRSLSTLYDMVGGRSPCVLLLRSMNKQAVVGVYVSCAIAPCHKAGTSSQRGDYSCFCFRLNSVTIATGSGNSMYLNTVSFFKSVQARKHPPVTPSAVDIEGEEQGGNTKEEKDKSSKKDDAQGQGGGVRNSYRHSSTKDRPNSMKSKERERGEAGKSSGSQSGIPAEPYTMDSYVDFVKNNYISGDASVLMFGATAARQPLNAIRLDRELRMCYTAPSETFGNPNLVPEECSPFPVDIVEVYVGRFLDPDVDMSLLNDVDGKEGRDEKMTSKTDKGSLVSTRSSSVYTAVNPLGLGSASAMVRSSDADRDREEATVQVQESYSYGSRTPKKGTAMPTPPSSQSLSVSVKTCHVEREKEKEREREKDSETSFNDGDMDRPWEEDKRDRLREEEELGQDGSRKFLLLTPANLGCMPPVDEDFLEPIRAPVTGMGGGIPTGSKAMVNTCEDTQAEAARALKHKEKRLSEEVLLEGDLHNRRHSSHSQIHLHLGDGSQGARRRAISATNKFAGVEERQDTEPGYLRNLQDQEQELRLEDLIPHSSKGTRDRDKDKDKERDKEKEREREANSALSGSRMREADVQVEVELHNNLYYESAGYHQVSTFEGKNTMVLESPMSHSPPLTSDKRHSQLHLQHGR